MDYLHSTDLVIVEQASKLLVNYALLAKQRYGGPKVAFWGHGRNFQRHRGSMVGELIKRKVSLHPHWWFAYNTTSARAVQSLGYPTHRITVVNNAVDTAALITARTTTSPDELRNLRFRFGLHGDNVAIFCGALYPDKRLPFLIEAAHDIRRQIPDFELLILGAGQEEPTLRTQIAHLPWIHYVGPKFDIDRVPYFLLSKVLLLPGLVGLAIIDSFAFQVPLITVDLPYHSPEIEYLADGRNGVLLPRDTSPLEYSTAVASIMKDDAQLAKLRLGCVEAASIYTVEAMVDRFTRGVLHAFAA